MKRANVPGPLPNGRGSETAPSPDRKGAVVRMLVLCLGVLGLTGCRLDMHDQPRYRFDASSDFWSDRRAARPQVQGTVARGALKTDTALWTGKIGNIEIDYFPMPVTKQMIERGRDRFTVYCSPCHGVTGHGDGVIVSRGLKNPPSYHTEAMREMTPGHIVNVVTNGIGAMFSYASRVPLNDRWAIASYIKVLQQSQYVTSAELTPEQRAQADTGPPAPAAPHAPEAPKPGTPNQGAPKGDAKKGGAH